MELKLKEIIGCLDILKEITGTKLPFSISYRLANLMNELDTPLTLYEKTRMDLFKEYGEPDDEDLVIPDDNKQIFMQKMNELHNETITIKFEKFDVSDFDEKFELEPLKVHKIFWIFN